ncbi:hypothetical protein [Williamsia phyllosphaerae]|uniref:Transporter n=1 Tax=Williamsia phyllosphaerae TaxID=885042 RepID=A0ABQ1UTL5_9NOCA|nr:hypothetical protein [Williamsia phyllosphaerae]GGF24962.1 transporter [Williamsia phyllosphaerae]
MTLAPPRETPSGSSRQTVAALVDLDRAIRRASPAPRGLRIVGGVLAVFVLIGIAALVMTADAGSARRTTAAVVCFVVVGALCLAPLIASRPTGVSPVDVRHLPVSATALRAASIRSVLRGPGLVFEVVALLVVPLAWFTDPSASTAASVVATAAVIPLAGVGVIGPRVLGLTYAQAMRSQTGRIVSTVLGVAAIAGIYVVYLLLTQGVIDPADRGLQIAARVLPTGWPVVAGEAVDSGRWWLAAIVVLGLVAVALGIHRLWSGRIDTAMYSDAVSSASRSRTRGPRRPVTASPTVLVLRTEARMLVTDPQRLGLAIMPLAFIVIGVVLMLTSADVYGMQYGAPLVVFMCGSMLANTYGLDRWGFALLVTSPAAAPLVIRSRMILAASIAVPVGVVGTVVARLVRDTDPSTWPVAAAVIVAGTITASGMAALLPALSPYRVPPGSSISSMSSRGSMTTASVGYSLAAVAAMAVMCVPGIVIGLLVEGPAAYLAVVVQLAVGLPALVVAHRVAVRLVAQRGPEILTAVTATS